MPNFNFQGYMQVVFQHKIALIMVKMCKQQCGSLTQHEVFYYDTFIANIEVKPVNLFVIPFVEYLN